MRPVRCAANHSWFRSRRGARIAQTQTHGRSLGAIHGNCPRFRRTRVLGAGVRRRRRRRSVGRLDRVRVRRWLADANAARDRTTEPSRRSCIGPRVCQRRISRGRFVERSTPRRRNPSLRRSPSQALFAGPARVGSPQPIRQHSVLDPFATYTQGEGILATTTVGAVARSSC